MTQLANYIITVVTDDNAMRTIFAEGGGDSLLLGAAGKLFINCATITPQVHIEVEALSEKVGAQSLEACMASSIPQARQGNIYLMCGGKLGAFNKAKYGENLTVSMLGPKRYVDLLVSFYNLCMPAFETGGKRNRAGKKAFPFEISEDLQGNWEKSIPVVLNTLKELG